MTTTGLKCGVALATAGALLAFPARSQTTGDIRGEVVDAVTAAPVGDAVVIAVSPALQGEQTAVTDAAGAFEISLLPPGAYSLIVQREGYQPLTEGGLQLRLDHTLKVKLQIAPLVLEKEEVEIVMGRPLIDVTSPQTGAVVSKEQMALVPYGRTARNFEAVVTSVPAVHADTYGYAVSGAGSPEWTYVVDGVQVNNPALGTQGTTLLQDFVQEVDVKTGGYQAEYGRATGGIVNVVTKSGGNDFHGSLFVNWSPYEAPRKVVPNAGYAITGQTAQRYNLDFGAELGGPILKDRLWFYAGFAPQLQSWNLDRIIQTQRDDGAGRAVLDPASGGPAMTEVGRDRFTRTLTSYQFTGKLTLLLDENHTLSLAGYGNPSRQSGTQGVGNYSLGASGYDVTYGSTDLSLRYGGKLFHKSMLVEATAAYHHQDGGSFDVAGVAGQGAEAMRDLPLIQWWTTLSLLDFAPGGRFDDGLAPASQGSAAVRAACAVQPNGFDPCPVRNYLTGGVGYVPRSALDRAMVQLKLTNFVELAGHHQLKSGADLLYDRYDDTTAFTGTEEFRALPATGAPQQISRYTVLFGEGLPDPRQPGLPFFQPSTDGALRLASDTWVTRTHSSAFSAFVQDTWNILDKVVLDAGVRVEHQRIYADPRSLDPNGNLIDGPAMTLTSWMPRLGLIWDFTGRGLSKVYASAGRFYEHVPLVGADGDLSNGYASWVGYSTDASSCRNPKDPRTCAVITGGAGNGRTFSFSSSNGIAVSPDLQGQYVDEYQAGAQYQMVRDLSLGVDYVRKQLGRVIEDMSVDDGATYFIANPGAPCSQAAIAAGACGFIAVTGTGLNVLVPAPRRIYDGVTLSAHKAFSDGWLGSASWTYSSLRGNFQGLYRQESGQLMPNALSEYDLVALLPNRDGPLPGDIPNSFKADAGWVRELDASTRLTLGASFRADQGTPLSYLGAPANFSSGYGASEGFILPRGSAGRLPWSWQLDLRASATRKLGETFSLGVNVDLFNVTDNREVTAREQRYTFDPVSPIVNGTRADLAYLKNSAGEPVTRNTLFLQPTAFQLPFTARLGVRLSF